MVIWLTGLSNAGKSTLGNALASALRAEGRRVELLDSDVLRPQLSPGLGFAKSDRELNVQRLAVIAQLLARHGVIAIVAAVSPYRDARAAARQLIEADGAPFLEVYLECAIAVAAARDQKGLYRRALDGTLPDFAGVTSPYEEPVAPELVLPTDTLTIAASVTQLLALVRARLATD